MASNSLICANNNSFNKYILGDDAFYFNDAEDVTNYLLTVNYFEKPCQLMLTNNKNKIRETYDWDLIVDQYSNHFIEINNSKITKQALT
jgi:hypothetical protein